MTEGEIAVAVGAGGWGTFLLTQVSKLIRSLTTYLEEKRKWESAVLEHLARIAGPPPGTPNLAPVAHTPPNGAQNVASH